MVRLQTTKVKEEEPIEERGNREEEGKDRGDE